MSSGYMSLSQSCSLIAFSFGSLLISVVQLRNTDDKRLLIPFLALQAISIPQCSINDYVGWIIYSSL